MMNGRELEAHRYSFEGSTSELATHLVDQHGAHPLLLADHAGGMTQGDWVALDNAHINAHENERTTG